MSEVGRPRLQGEYPADRIDELIGVELRWRRGRKGKCTAINVEFSIGQTKSIAGEYGFGMMVEENLMMHRMPRRMQNLEIATCQRKTLAGFGRHDALARNGQNLAIQRVEGISAIDSDGSIDKLAWIDHVRRTSRVQYGFRIR